MQEKVDGEFYAVVDIPQKMKLFFENQKIVNFQKTWVYRDNVSMSMQKPDLQYLSSFELIMEVIYLNEQLYQMNLLYLLNLY